MLGTIVVADLFQYAGEITYHDSEESTFLGRPVTIYYFYSGTNDEYTEMIIVDKKTGVCLKHTADVGVSGDGFLGLETNLPTFEVTQFEIKNANVTTFLQTYIDKIDIFEWDTDLMQQVGLNPEVLPTMPNWTLQHTEWYEGSREEVLFEWTAAYTISGDKNELKSDIVALMQAFFDAGACFNDSRDEVAWQNEDIYFDQVEDNNYLGFIAYVDDAQVSKISIDANYGSGRWTIEFSIAYENEAI